jgi:NADH-quinone oxidoreductase subunit N
VDHSLQDSLESIRTSIVFFAPELLIVTGIGVIVISGLIRKNARNIFHGLTLIVLVAALLWCAVSKSPDAPIPLFSGMIRYDAFSIFLRCLFFIGAVFTVCMTMFGGQTQKKLPEYYALILTVTLGANLLVMSQNLLMVFLSLEVLSISSYILTAFAYNKKATEGSMKYFIFGSVASAFMLYGFSLLYGITGTLSFTSVAFVDALVKYEGSLFLVAGVFSLAGFLYKVAAVPMHPWAPDVYEAAPMPVVAFFSVVPKLAGVAVLTRFFIVLDLFGESMVNWQSILAGITILTLTVGNFSALLQKNVRRLMAYSSIAQSGFLLVPVLTATGPGHGIHFFLFYASVYLVINFLVFFYLQYFEMKGITTIAGFAGLGRAFVLPCIFILIGMVALTGLPPTAGFTAKLFIFSSLWEAYAHSGQKILLWLLLFGLLNTVVSLFYYLRIPYYSFIRSADQSLAPNNPAILNLLGAVLVLVVLILFFSPGLLMGWINKITFAF